MMSATEFYNDVRGTGKPLVCLHGWGMHGGIFEPVADVMQKSHQLMLLDLPGHGNSRPIADFDNLDVLTSHVKSQIENLTSEKITILAWSMGGLVGQWLAINHPELIEKLVLVSGTACFENKDDWQHGIQPQVLQQFAAGLEHDYKATLDRFLSLQFMGADDQKTHLRHARDLIAHKPVPDVHALDHGLQLLSNTDLRSHVQDIHCPVLIMSGERDKLVPTSAVRMLAEKVKNGNAVIFKGCGHAPFLSHTPAFINYLKRFLHE